MEVAEIDNDTRGWIMCIVSGIACSFGSLVICVDILVRLIPSQRNFRIQDSNIFLACSLSLSFGVMIFSALFSMLPSSKKYMTKGGLDESIAGIVMMACFVGGFIGIQVLSRILHQFMPSHVVDCDHTHDEHALDDRSEATSRRQSRVSRARRRISRRTSEDPCPPVKVAETNGHLGASESTPLLPTDAGNGRPHAGPLQQREASARSNSFAPVTRTNSHGIASRDARGKPPMQSRRPSMVEVQNRVISFVKDTKCDCEGEGPCYGYSDPCGQECFKHLSARSALSRVPTLLRTPRSSLLTNHQAVFAVPETEEEDDTAMASPISPTFRSSRTHSRDSAPHHQHDHDHAHAHATEDDDDDDEWCEQMSEDLEAQHHHHVPTNAFLAIGLQTVIAIALHKFPEGFITYATNHANPSLGFNVFMALFVHNIAEGFAMALPLYMALGSRLKAILWSSALGGLSQPLGAAVAVLWFKLAKRNNIEIDNVAYACLFAVTAGIMTSVALQLFVESLSLNHNRNLSIGFAFLGMTLLGFSNVIAK